LQQQIILILCVLCALNAIFELYAFATFVHNFLPIGKQLSEFIHYKLFRKRINYTGEFKKKITTNVNFKTNRREHYFYQNVFYRIRKD